MERMVAAFQGLITGEDETRELYDSGERSTVAALVRGLLSLLDRLPHFSRRHWHIGTGKYLRGVWDSAGFNS